MLRSSGDMNPTPDELPGLRVKSFRATEPGVNRMARRDGSESKARRFAIVVLLMIVFVLAPATAGLPAASASPAATLKGKLDFVYSDSRKRVLPNVYYLVGR